MILDKMVVNADNKNVQYSIFKRFISLIFLVFISLLLCIGWKIGNLNKKFAQENLIYVAHNINQNLSNLLNYTEDKMDLIGRFVAEQALEDDFHQVFNLLQLIYLDHQKQLTSWRGISWADANHIVKVNNKEILKKPVDLSYRAYSKNLSTEAFNLVFNKVDISYLTKRRIIPTAMGIKNKQGNFLGSVTVGLDIEDIEMHVSKLVESDQLYYLLASTKNNEIIFRSADFRQEHYPELEKIIQQMVKDKIEQQLYTINNKHYLINKFPKFPFAIIVGTNKTIIGYKEYFNTLALYKIELLMGLLIISILIYLFYHSILEPFLTLSESALAISRGDISTPSLTNINSKEGVIVATALERIKASLRIEKDLVQELSNAHNKLSVVNLHLENKVAESILDTSVQG